MHWFPVLPLIVTDDIWPSQDASCAATTQQTQLLSLHHLQDWPSDCPPCPLSQQKWPKLPWCVENSLDPKWFKDV